jgi:phosphoserine aminotransferase
VVVVREDLLGHALPVCPSAFNYKAVSDNQSMYNTPPTYAIYIAGLVFQWLKRQGGIAAMEQRNIAKARLLYRPSTTRSLYENRVAPCLPLAHECALLPQGPDPQRCLPGRRPSRGLLSLKGHKSLGGMRASIYNAMPLEGVQALVRYMREFERTNA